MSSLRLLLIAASGLMIGTAACEQVRPRAEPRRVIARIEQVGGEADGRVRAEITENEYRQELARLRFGREGNSVQAAPLPPTLKVSILDQLVQRRMLLVEAEDRGVRASTVAVAREVERMKGALTERHLQHQLVDNYETQADLEALLAERLTVGRLMDLAAHRGVEVGDTEIEAAWNALPPEDRIKKPRVHASQIVLRTEEEGAKVRSELKKGMPFEAAASAHSIGPERERGGDLGWFESGSMPKVFEVCFTMKLNEISPLTPSEYGFHIFKVAAREPAAELSFAAGKDRLKAKLLRQKLEDAENAFLAKVKARFRVVKDDHRIASIE